LRTEYILEEVQRRVELRGRVGYQQSRRIRGEGMADAYAVE